MLKAGTAADELAALQSKPKPPRTLEEFLKLKYGHRVGKLWLAFKRLHDSERGSLARFGQAVTDLDQWEDVRYPAPAAMTAKFTATSPPLPAPSSPTRRGSK